MRTCRCMLFVTWLAMVSAGHAATVDLKPLLKALQSVGPKGAGNREAARAWQQVVTADTEQLTDVLAGMDGAGPLAINWIRTAADTIAERHLHSGGRLPAAKLEQFVKNTEHHPQARRTAYEWLLRADPKAKRLIREMLDDPSLELRRDAVAQLISDAIQVEELSDANSAVPLYRRAFSAARDLDQIKLLSEKLKKLKQEFDLPRHLGYILRWKLIGPFDNTGEKGFDVVYPPERSIDLGASCQGKHAAVGWIDYVSTHEYGQVDFNKALVEEKEVIGYAMTEFISERRQEIDLRLSSFNATKLWLNGTLVGDYNIYHSGSQLDQYVSRAVLQPGRNVILVKVCQNEQTQSWAKDWGFKLRVCDRPGTAILSADRDKTSTSN